MVSDAVRSLRAEPRAPQAPRRVWRDWALVAVLVPTALAEGVMRDDVAWRPVAVVLTVGLTCALMWRRSHPLGVVMAAFGTIILIDIVGLIGADDPVGLYTMALVLLLPYSLVRWGSGREIETGMVFILVALALSLAADYTGIVDSVVGSVILLFPATVGAAVRYWTSSRIREIDQAKLRERAELARELHDTVAHHVSAIAVRAQAGRVVAASDPDAALDALLVIEEEASRALAELRIVVGGLREGEAAALVPPPGVADLERLARSMGSQPRVEVDLSGDLDDLRPSVGTTVFRIAQESITNAVRHARHATRIEVRVAGDADSVHLTVSDDGDPGASGRSLPGYGLLGMTERAALVGGSFEAGPGPERGWTVSAVLPRTVARA